MLWEVHTHSCSRARILYLWGKDFTILLIPSSPWILSKEEKNVLVLVSKSYSVVSLLQARQEQHFALYVLQPRSCREDLSLNCSVDVTRTMEERTAVGMINSQPIPYLSGICCSRWISIWGPMGLIPGYFKGWLRPPSINFSKVLGIWRDPRWQEAGKHCPYSPQGSERRSWQPEACQSHFSGWQNYGEDYLGRYWETWRTMLLPTPVGESPVQWT